VLVGLPVDVSESNQTQSKLVDNVAKKLSSLSGVAIKPSDLSAVHRNAQPKAGSSTRNRKPPSVTVCFHNTNLKDNVLQKYTNFDKKTNKSRDVRLYQSLSKFYSDLKTKISNHLETELGKNKVKWIHWRSQSAGFVVKLKDDSTSKVSSALRTLKMNFREFSDVVSHIIFLVLSPTYKT
jgi:hypothetical protein